MAIIHDTDFREWESRVRESVRGDPMFRFDAYRVSLYLIDLSAVDAKRLRARRGFPSQTDQLLRAVASVGANIAEGLGRSSAAERTRFFSIALGSLREALTWYRAVESGLGSEYVDLRSDQLSELRRLLIGAQKWLATKPQGTNLF